MISREICGLYLFEQIEMLHCLIRQLFKNDRVEFVLGSWFSLTN